MRKKMKEGVKRSLAVLLAFAMALPVSYNAGLSEAQAATPTYFEAYSKASYETTSTDFAMTVSGQKVDVVEYFEGRYSYAHIAYEGTATFEIESLNGNITSYNISPHSYNIDATVNGNKLIFDMEQKNSRYLVIQVKVGNQQYELIVSADPDLGLTAPTVDNKTVVNVKDRGVNSSNSGTGKSNSDKIQAIINEVSANGGGTVYFPAGEYKFVTLDAKSNVTLYLDANAFLRGSGDRTEYDWADSGTNGRQANRRDILIGNGVKNFKIIGKGTIDANSAILALPQSADGGTTDVPSISRDEYNAQNGTNYYPNGWDDFRKGIVDANWADGIEFRGVTFMDATGWTFHIQNSSNIVMENVKMLNDYDIVHSDGYDLAACQYVTVTDCLGVCGDDVFCPKGSNSSRDMHSYLFKDGVAYAKGGAGCKIGVQAQSNTYNIEFNNIDVIRGYRGFSVSRDEGSGDWHDIRFIDIRTEKLYIENANDTGQYRPAPFIIWSHQKNDQIGDVWDVEVTRCSIENCGGLKGILEGETSATSKVPGYVSNVRFTDLVMDGRTITEDNYSTKVMYKGNVQADTISYDYTKLVAPATSVYEAENGTRDGSSTSNATACSGEMMVGNLGLINDVSRSVTLTVYADAAGEHDVDVYYCVDGTRTFYVSVNGGEAKALSCTGNSFSAPSMTTMKLNLNKGENTITFGNPNAAAPNLDKIEIVQKEASNTISLDYEAEEATLAGIAVVNNNAANCSGKLKVNDIGYNGTSEGTVTFKVNAPIAGYYDLVAYACTKADRDFSVNVNDDKVYTLSCPGNGVDYVTPYPSSIVVKLNKGENTITLGNPTTPAPNLDKISLVADGETMELEAYKLEAEKAVLNGSANAESNNEMSNGAYVGSLGGSADSTITYNVKMNQAGKRLVKIYYATYSQRSLSVKVNGGDSVDLTCPSTGNTWTTLCSEPLEVILDLNAGNNVIQLSGVDNGYAPNIDRIEIGMTEAEYEAYEKILNSKIRVTCVGDSITWGYGASNSEADYPSQLQSFIGTTDFAITGCGSSGSFACGSTDYCSDPYINTNAYQQSLVSEPDIVIINLGTNDASDGCWSQEGIEDVFREGYENLINTYLNLDTKPRVVLATPLTSVGSGNRDNNNVNGTIPIIKELADKYDLTLVDLHSMTIDWTRDDYLGDGLHPNDAGYKLLGQMMVDVVKDESAKLTSVSVDGEKIKDFDDQKEEFTVMSSGSVPQISAEAYSSKVDVSVEQASGLNSFANINVYTATGALLKSYPVNVLNTNIDDEANGVFTMEAEHAVNSNGAGVVKAADCSNGFYVGSLGGNNNGTVTFNVTANTAGKRELRVYYATLNQREVNVTVNGNLAGTLTCPGSGGWDTASATPQTIVVNLNAGQNTIALNNGVNGAYAPNVDRIELVLADEDETTTEQPTDPPVEEPGEVFGQVISSPAEGTINVVWGYDPNIYKGELYNVYVDGELKLSKVVCGAYDITGISGGTHTVKITAVLNDIESNGVTGDVTVAEKAESKAAVELNGFQISTTVEGYRTLYSVSDPNGEVTSVGLVYGLADYASESDMVINSTNSKVFDYAATEAGKMSETVSELESATSYTMTMRYGTVNTDFLSADVSVRAYAVLKDGTVIYSDVQTTSVFDIAAVVYGKSLMNTVEAHNYLYTNILTVVDPSYKAVDFNWNNTIVGA